jgi:fructokinase
MMPSTVVSIGEVVWDIFPDHRVLGGAPLNVAYHLSTLGIATRMVSRLGTDDLGRETLEKITALGLATDGMQQDSHHTTGRVTVTVDAYNEPSFDIVAPAAWDFIDEKAAGRAAGGDRFLLVFGTLAQRAPASRAAVRALWQRAAVRCYDVNLRPPFTTRELVLDSLTAADVVKMNEKEIAVIAGWTDTAANDKAQTAKNLLDRYNLEVVLVTEGDAGAWLVCPQGHFSHPGFPVEVADTVGAGDAFFATFIEGYLTKRPWPECLARANHRGAYVASQPGATPPMAAYRYSNLPPR